MAKALLQTNTGTVEVTGIEANATKTITVQQADWSKLIAGKIAGTGAATSILKIDVQGTAEGKN